MTTTLSPPNRTVSDRTVSDRTVSDRTVSNRTVSNRTVSNRTVSNRTVSGRTVSGRPGTANLMRYVVVTLVASPGTLVVYGLLLANTGWPAAAANLAAAMIIAGPTYVLNRRWVWGRRSPHSMATEVAPYWAATALTVSLSSAAAAVLDRLGAADSVLVAATFAVYTALWLARFFFLDVLFSPVRRSS